MSTPQPERAWQIVLDQLRMDMPVASFTAWVKDTEFISFETPLFTVGSATAYGCEWLTSRLTSTVSRILAGILDQPVSVQFVVHEPSSAYEDGGAEIEDETLDQGKPPEELTLQAEYQTIYDEIVQPEQVIVFPGYFLRYIPMLGVELAWLYIGFRQAAYEAGASNQPGKKVSAPAKKVAYYAGMSPRSFWRWAARPATWKLLRWLVKPVEETPKWNRGNDGRPHQATRNYRVAMTMPLTPFDELALRGWLYRKLAEGNSSLATLRSALETPVEELLPWPEKMPSLEESTGEPHSVRDVVLEVCNPIAEGEKSQLNELTEQLVQYLMPSKDLVFLTHYFVSHWLTRLGPGSGWFVTMLRDRCYLNPRTGEIRDEVRLIGGYAEAARWLGVKRVKTIWEWLRSPDVAIFLRETGRENGSWEEAPRRIKVCLGEPMTDEDQDQANVLLAKSPPGASGIHSDGDQGNAVGASGTHSDADPEPAIGGSCRARNQQIGASDSHTGATDIHKRGASVTLGGASDTHRIGASGAIDWRDWHSLNSLTPGCKHVKNSQTTPGKGEGFESENVGAASPTMVVDGDWKIGDLLSKNRISAKSQEHLLEKGVVTARAFISWLLYAASTGGSGIRDPVSQAVSRLAQDPTQGAGGAYDRLAGLPANELADLIIRAIGGQNPWKTDWRTVMEGSPRTRLRALVDQLGISAPDSNDR
ncbi:MAG: hypothetical protein PHQ40_00865 [Anaerolineaceae bacterium]|nr:hypothetical protein [Anaerolineaceae bacterium]